jgi:rhamnogalacturonyl hydrolase YesR
MEHVADWQLEHPSKHKTTDWTQGAYYAGLVRLYQVSKDERYLNALLAMGEKNQWKLGPIPYNADDQAVGSTYCQLYAIKGDPSMIEGVRAGFDYIIANPKGHGTVQGDPGFSFTNRRWNWCDALFMAPPAWTALSKVTNDRKYVDFMDKEWWVTTSVLYDQKAHLFFRDSTFFKKKTSSGGNVFWSRGNGWVLAATARVLTDLPQDYPSRKHYEGLFQQMSEAILKLQQPDGMWRPSLLAPDEIPPGESSGTAFFIFGFTWGINHGLLDEKTYWPAVVRGWTALKTKVRPDGKLGAVQPIGTAPGALTDDSTEVYGTGAFLFAGSEIFTKLSNTR